MTPSTWLFDVLRKQIPFRPTAWRAHRGDPWVIGYGHTGAPGAAVVAGATITMEQAEQILRQDIARYAIAYGCDSIEQGPLDVLVALAVATHA